MNPLLIRVNTTHGAWIREFRARADVVWATGWNSEANNVLAPLLGIGALPLVRMPEGTWSPDDKVPRVAAYAGDRPVVWLDDQLGAPAREWARTRRARTLLIDVDPFVGLTRALADRALEWISAG